MKYEGRREPTALATMATFGVAFLLVGAGEKGPASSVAAAVPSSYHDDLLVLGFGLLGLVAAVLTLFLAAKVTAFLLLLAFTGREALSELPEPGPLIRVAVGIMLIMALLFGVTLKMSDEWTGGDVPFLSDGPDDQPAAAPGIVTAEAFAVEHTTDGFLADRPDSLSVPSAASLPVPSVDRLPVPSTTVR